MSDFKLCQSCCKKESLEIIILMENSSSMSPEWRKKQLNYWGGQKSTDFNTLTKGEMSQDVICEILRKTKKTNLKLKSSITIYIYKNSQWVKAILSPKTIGGKDNTITLVHWPYFKSPANDNDPVGIKTYGTLAAEANQDSSFSAILSEGRGNGTYVIRTAFDGCPSFRPSDTSLAFIRGLCFSDVLCGSSNVNNGPTISNKGSFFTFNKDTNDTQKIYYSVNSGYVDTSYYQNNQWPAGFGLVTEENVPFTTAPGGEKFWNYEYFPRIPESGKDKILFRDVKVAFADYTDYVNKWSEAENCIPYYNSFDDLNNFPLCYPNCLKDPREKGCPNPSFLRATEASATIANTQVTAISIDPSKKGIYKCMPTIQIIPKDNNGVGAVAIQRDGETFGPIGNFQYAVKPSNNPNIDAKGFGYTTAPAIVYQKVLDEKSIFSENFSSVQRGNEQDLYLYGFTGWSGNQNFPYVNDVFQAGGAVFLSGSNSYIISKKINLNFPAGNFGISFDIKGADWLKETLPDYPNNILNIEVNGTNLKTNIDFKAGYYDNFESKYIEFTATNNNNIKFSPLGTGQLILSNIKVYGPGDAAAGYERGWILRSDFTKNFDDVYAAMPYIFARSTISQFGQGAIYSSTLYGSASQGLSAVKNAALKFSQTSKKMIIFVADSFMAYQGTLNDQTSYRADVPDSPESLPYPSKAEVKSLLSEKNIRLHAITFNGTRLAYDQSNGSFVDDYNNLSRCLRAYAPYKAGTNLKTDGNTVSGYVSAIEEITNAKNDLYNNASGNKLWIFGTVNANNAFDFYNVCRDRSISRDGTSYDYGGGRVLPQPSTWRDISTGIFYDIKVLLNEVSGSY
jgi:hypothetical protein